MGVVTNIILCFIFSDVGVFTNIFFCDFIILILLYNPVAGDNTRNGSGQVTVLTFIKNYKAIIPKSVLPFDQSTGPGKSTAKCGKAYQVALFNLSFFPSFTQRYGNRSCGSITVLLNIVIYLIIAQL